MSESNGYITRDELLSSTTVRYTEFRIPDDCPIESLAGKKIKLRSLTAKERAQHEDFFADPRTGLPDPERELLRREKWVLDCACDKDGHRLFEKEHIRKLSKVDGGLLEAIAQAAVDHCRISLSSQLEKKSEETPALSSS